MSLIVPPSYRDVLGPVKAMLERAQSGAFVEIEGKLGYFDSRGHFDSGVPLPTFNRLLKKMQSFSNWDSIVDWTDTQDFFFDNSIRGTKDSNGDASFMRKTVIENINIKAPECQSALRISWKKEEPAQAPSAFTTLVRVKKRKVFCYKHFEFCFSYIWQGKTVEDAQTRQPLYEIEVECNGLGQAENIEYLALSFLMKLGDLLQQPGAVLHLEIMNN